MEFRLLPVLAFSFVLGAAASAQNENPAQLNGTGGFGQRGGMGRGLMGTVTQVDPGHYTIKTETGETYTVYFSVNTRIVKMPAGHRGPGGGMAAAEGRGGAQGMGPSGTPPVQIKPADIKVGDVITAMGEADGAAKSVGAIAIALVDPERARQMHEMQANYGKTWIMGKVTAIDGVKVTLMGSIDNAAHAFVADENTTFRKRREPITLADIQPGDLVRADGALRNGVFTATAVNVSGVPPGGGPTIPRGMPPQ